MANDEQDDLVAEFRKLQAETSEMHQSIVKEPSSFITSSSLSQILKELRMVSEKVCALTEEASKIEEKLKVQDVILKELHEIRQENAKLAEKQKIQDDVSRDILKELREIRKENAELRQGKDNSAVKIEFRKPCPKNDEQVVTDVKTDASTTAKARIRPEKSIVDEIIGTWRKESGDDCFYHFVKYEKDGNLINETVSNSDIYSDCQINDCIDVSKCLKGHHLVTGSNCRYIEDGKLVVITNHTGLYAFYRKLPKVQLVMKK